MYKIYIKLKCRTIGARINTVHTSILQAGYVLNGRQHSTVVQEVPFDSFTPCQLHTKVTCFILYYFGVIPSQRSLADQNKYDTQCDTVI